MHEGLHVLSLAASEVIVKPDAAAGGGIWLPMLTVAAVGLGSSEGQLHDWEHIFREKTVVPF